MPQLQRAVAGCLVLGGAAPSTTTFQGTTADGVLETVLRCPREGVQIMERKQIDISDIPALVALAEQVQQTQEPHVLTLEGQPLAILEPLPLGSSPDEREANPNAWLEPLIGAARSEGPSDVSEHKQQYLAEAYYGKPVSDDQ
jgi:hypothetical protein